MRRIDARGNYSHDVPSTEKSVTQIAEMRAMMIDDPIERNLYISTFLRVRQVALKVRDVDNVDVLWKLVKNAAVTEAAYIEALASLRAEGHLI